MDGCPICQHPKHDEMMTTLRRGIKVGLVAHYFRKDGIDKMALAQHCVHEPIGRMDRAEAGAECLPDPPRGWRAQADALAQAMGDPTRAVDVLKPAEPYIRAAVRQAGTNRDEQARLVERLNELLMQESMGL